MSDTENSELPEPTLEDRMRGRFQTAAGGQPPTDQQRATVRTISNVVVELACAIEELVPPGRNKSLAMTALEDVHMRANRGVFVDDHPFNRETAR